jgi:hypothetical protein
VVNASAWRPVPIVQVAAWAKGPVWTGAENPALSGIRSPDQLYRLRQYGPPYFPGFGSLYPVHAPEIKCENSRYTTQIYKNNFVFSFDGVVLNARIDGPKKKTTWRQLTQPITTQPNWIKANQPIPCGTALNINKSSATEEIPRILWQPKVHSRFHNSPPIVLILSNIKPVHAFQFYVKTQFNIILPRSPRYSRRSLSLKFSNQNSVCLSLLLHTCHIPRPSHPFCCVHPNIWREAENTTILCAGLKNTTTIIFL